MLGLRSALAVGLIAGALPAAAAHSACHASTAPTCTGLRPGSEIHTTAGACTAAFLVVDARSRYLVTAGHCAPPNAAADRELSGDLTWPGATGPIVTDHTGRVIGTFAYAVSEDRADFALVRLSPNIGADNAVCGWAGPPGLADAPSAGDRVHLFGNGVVAGDLVPARRAVVAGTASPTTMTLATVTTSGDSGGPVWAADGRALGIVIAGGAYVMPDPGTTLVVRLAPMLARASKALGVRLGLVTGSLT